jgi:hypothetical protein
LAKNNLYNPIALGENVQPGAMWRGDLGGNMKKCGNCKKWRPIKTHKGTEGICMVSGFGWTMNADTPGCFVWKLNK